MIPGVRLDEIRMKLGEWEGYGWTNAVQALREVLAENDVLKIEVASLRKEIEELRHPAFTPDAGTGSDPDAMRGHRTVCQEPEVT